MGKLKSKLIFLIFFGINNPTFAGTQVLNQALFAPSQYIVILKNQEIGKDSRANATGESVKQIADELIIKARQNQMMLDKQKGIIRSESNTNAINKLGFVYEYAIKGFSATLTDDSVKFLSNNPAIDYIEVDGIMKANAIQNPVPSWGLDRIDQRDFPLDQSYQYATNGSNVHVYVLDTGIRLTHTEFSGRVGSGFDFIDNDTNANDCNGHGTHVAGTIGGISYGVAKRAILHPVRVLNCSGSGLTSQVIAGVDWVTANRQSPAVANMSLGGGIQPSLDAAVNNAINAGITFAIAAGNDSGANACNKSPAGVASAITVASSTSSDFRSNFSNIGTCVDIFAPGSLITSAWHTSDTALNTISGTSMATPHVAGVAGLYLETNISASPAQVTNALITASTPNKISDAGAGTPNRLLFSQVTTQPPTQALGWLVPIINLILNQ